MKKIKWKVFICFLVLILSCCNIIMVQHSEAVSVSKVTGLYMYSNTSSSITLKWKKARYASGYKVYRATSKSGKYYLSATIKNVSTTTYKNSKLSSGKTYYYKIRAYKTLKGKNYYGSYSNILKTYTSKPSSTNNSSAMKAYKKFLTNTPYVHPENYEEPAKTEKFAIIDINKDGIKELLITDRNAYNNRSQDNGYQYAYVYTYKDGKVKYCGYAHGSSFTSLYVDGKGRLAYNWGGSGHSQYMYYGLNSSKNKLTITIFTKHFDMIETFDKEVYDYNRYNPSKTIKISESTFESERKIASSGKLLKVYSNTSNYRNKYLK